MKSICFIVIFGMYLQYGKSIFWPGKCQPDTCHMNGLCLSRIAPIGENVTDEHRCRCYSSYTGPSCSIMNLQVITVGPYPASFFTPQIAYPLEWRYYYFGPTDQRPLPRSSQSVTIYFISWDNPLDSITEPCTFVISTSGAIYQSHSTDFSAAQIIVGNGTLTLSGDFVSLSTYISVTRNATQEDNAKHGCSFQIEAIVKCDDCVHGKCKEGFGNCICDYGWTGHVCDEKLETISYVAIIVFCISSCLFGVFGTIFFNWVLERRRETGRAYRALPQELNSE